MLNVVIVIALKQHIFDYINQKMKITSSVASNNLILAMEYIRFHNVIISDHSKRFQLFTYLKDILSIFYHLHNFNDFVNETDRVNFEAPCLTFQICHSVKENLT